MGSPMAGPLRHAPAGPQSAAHAVDQPARSTDLATEVKPAAAEERSSAQSSIAGTLFTHAEGGFDSLIPDSGPQDPLVGIAGPIGRRVPMIDQLTGDSQEEEERRPAQDQQPELEAHVSSLVRQMLPACPACPA